MTGTTRQRGTEMILAELGYGVVEVTRRREKGVLRP
jgi:hypothetical protein